MFIRRYYAELFVCLLLFIFTFTAYLQVLNHEFVDYDDNVYITDNLQIQKELTLKNVLWTFTSTKASNWHPLTWLSHMLDFQLFGLNPKGHHLTNLLFHIANSLLLFIVLKRISNAIWCSAFVAALFALHPLHVESVAWVSERKDVLSTFFWMLTLWFYASYSEKPGLKNYFIVLLVFVLGLMSKPMLVVLPFVLLLLDYWPLGNLKRKQSESVDNFCFSYRTSHSIYLILEKVPFFILSAISCIVTYIVQQKGGAVSLLESLPLKLRIFNSLVAYIGYIQKMIWPLHLAPFYPHPGALPAWKAFAAGLLLIFISILVIWTARQFPYLVVGWMWYIGTLVPVIGLVQVGSQSMADRYTYVPLIGLFIMIAWGISDLSAKWRYHKPLLAILTVMLLSVLMTATWFQVQIWRNSRSLFEHTISVTDNNYLAYNGLGLVLAGEGKINEAVAYYNKAIKVKPNYTDAFNNYGNLLNDTGKLDEAKALFSRALEIKPDLAEAYNGLGIVLSKQGKLEEAIINYRKAIKIKPDIAQAYYNIGLDLSRLGKTDEAIFYYREALRIKPGYVEAQTNLGSILSNKGKFDEAVEYFFKILRVKPHDATAHYNLGAALELQGKTNEAVIHYAEALRLKPDFTLAKKSLEALMRPNRSTGTNK